METIGFLAVALMALVSTVVGVRLLFVSRRTREFPELALGLSLAGTTGIGFPVVLLAELRQTIGPLLAFAADFIGSFALTLGFVGFYVFTWRVFRPGSRWAAALTLLGGGAAIVATAATVWLAIGAETNEEKFQLVGSWEILLFVSAAVGFLWTAFEAFRYHAMLRRRLALGLADAIVVNRVLLWGLVGSSAGVTLSIMTALRLLELAYSSPVGVFTTAVCGFLASSFLYLAFMPPAAYLRWIDRPEPAPDETFPPGR